MTQPSQPPDDADVTFEHLTEIEATSPTLIEGLPGHGLVASIAVEQITQQLGLTHHGNIISDDFPSVTAFKDGRVRDFVRVYAGNGPDVMTLQSDVALPTGAFEPLSRCVLSDLAPEFERAIFLVGAPAESEEQVGDVFGVATDDELESHLREADIEFATGPGVISGVTGALVKECYHADVPSAVLIVRSNPYLPDPAAARAAIENAIEPLVGFDIDTTELQERADQIQSQMEQIAEQYREMMQSRNQRPEESPTPAMYQ